MTDAELIAKIEQLQRDHIAAGGFISHEEAERMIRKAYGLDSGVSSRQASHPVKTSKGCSASR